MNKKNFFELGYKRSNKNPKLFWKPMGRVRTCIDFRDSLSHSFYFFPLSELTNEEKQEYNKKLIEEYNLVNKNSLSNRLVFSDMSYCTSCEKEFVSGLITFGDEINPTCSKECWSHIKKLRKKEDKKESRRYKAKKCPICNKLPELESKMFPLLYSDNRHDHHIVYYEKEEKTIKICSSCHAKITLHPDKHPELSKYFPKGTRKEMLKRKKKKEKRCVDCNEILTGRKLKYCEKCGLKRKKPKGKKKYNYSHKWKSPSPMLKAWLND